MAGADFAAAGRLAGAADGDFAAAAGGEGGSGAAGPLCPIETEMPNSRHCPLTGANDRSKLTWVGTEGKKPAMCISPLHGRPPFRGESRLSKKQLLRHDSRAVSEEIASGIREDF